MTKLFDKAVEAARAFPPDVQDDIAHAILAMTQSTLTPEPVPDAHLGAVREGLRQAEAGELVSDEDVEKVLRNIGT